MWLLAKILAVVTRHPRSKVVAGVDFEWSDLWVCNLFRMYEILFGRRFGIKAEMSAGRLSDGREYQIAHSWEAACALVEIAVRDAFSFKWARLPVRIWIPMMQTPAGFSIPASPYLFAIAFDTSVNGATSGTNAISWSHTVTGSNAFAAVFLFQNSSNDDITATFNSVAMTKAGTSTQSADANKMSLLYLASPTTGTVAGSGSAASYFTGGSETFSGAAGGFDSVGTNNPASGGTLTLTTTVVAANCWLVSGCRASGNVLSASTGTTKRQTTTADYAIGDSNATVGTGSQSMSWTHVADNQGGVIISFSPTAASVSPNTKLWNISQAVKRASFF